MKVKELIEQYHNIVKNVEEAVNNPDISFSDGVESMRIFLEFLDEDMEKPKLEPKSKSKKHIKHNVKMSYLEKWIIKGDFEVFTLEQFFKVLPKQKRNDNLDRNVSGLVDKKMITQIGKDKFRVNR